MLTSEFCHGKHHLHFLQNLVIIIIIYYLFTSVCVISAVYLGREVIFPHFSMQKRLRPLLPRSAAKPS